MWVEAGAAEPLERPEHACAAHAAASGHFSTEVRGGTEGAASASWQYRLLAGRRGRRLHHAAGRARVADATGRERRRGLQQRRQDWRRPEVHALTALADGGALSLHRLSTVGSSSRSYK